METINWQDVITNFVALVGGGGTCLLAAAWLIKSVIADRLKANADTEIERVKNVLALDIEAFKIRLKADADVQIERLRHLLSSRISKIHEKEFEVLPKAWFMVHDAHGSAALPMATLRQYTDVSHLPASQFEDFLNVSRLSDHQKDALRKSPDRQKYFTEAMAGIELDDAIEKHRGFHNYLIEHRIFMTDELRKKFGAVDEDLSSALIDYSVGKQAKDFGMQRSAVKKVTGLKGKIEEVEQAVQKRLHYEEA